MRGSVAEGVAIPADLRAFIRTRDVALQRPVVLALVVRLAVDMPLVLRTLQRAGTVPILLFKRVLHLVARCPLTVPTACLMVL